MLSSELVTILKLYILLQILGFSGFFILFKYFKKLKDRGYFIGKVSGILIFSYLAWLLPSLKIIPYSQGLVVIILVIILLSAFYFFIKNKKTILGFLKKQKRIIIIGEVLFLIVFIAFIFLRSHGFDFLTGEKLRDLSIVSSIIRSDYFPPQEIWFSGQDLNIYYFGHFVSANFMKLTGIGGAEGFRLLSPIFLSLIMISSLGLIYNLTKSIKYSIFGGLLVPLIGNIDGLIQIISKSLTNFSWWQSAHIIPYTYQEFSFWSFLFGESHAFFMVHIFVLLFLYCSLNLIKSKKKRVLKNIILLGFLSLCLGTLAITNTWNYPFALIIVGGIIFYYFYSKNRKFSKNDLINSILSIFLITFLSIFLYLPFYLNYHNPSFNFQLVPKELRTTPLQFLILAGTFLLPILLYLFIKIRNAIGKEREWRFYYLLLLLPFLLALFFPHYFVLGFSLILGIIVFYLFLKEKKPTSSFLLLTILTTSILLLVPEILILKDIFTGEYLRYNTLSKLYIQALLLLPIIAIVSIYYFNKYFKKSDLKWIINVLVILPITASLIFPILGTYSITGRFNNPCFINTMEVMKTRYPQKYEAISWIQKNIKGQPVILEAPGNSYDYESAHISSFTGLPTIVQWPQHLASWMGEKIYDLTAKRTKDVKKIYNISKKDDISLLIKKYNIKYIFIGPKEKKLYSSAGLNSFDKYFKKIFSNSKTKIYKVDKYTE